MQTMLQIDKLLNDFGIDFNDLDNDEIWENEIDNEFKDPYYDFKNEYATMTLQEIKAADKKLVDLFNELYDIEEFEEEEVPKVKEFLSGAEKRRHEAEQKRLLQEKQAKEQQDRIRKLEEGREIEKQARQIQQQKELEIKQAELAKRAKTDELIRLFSQSQIRKETLAQLGVVFTGNRHEVEIDGTTYVLIKKMGYSAYKIRKK